MPSTLVHVALAGLLAAALLREDEFGRRAVGVVLVAAVLPDLDSFVSPFLAGAHRSLGHNVFLPLALVGAVAYDTRIRDRSWLRGRFGPSAPAVAWVALAGVAVAGVGLDYVTNGVNLFWPIHDQFYTLNGRAGLSNQRGFFQTFVDLSPERVRTTETLHYATGVDPSPGAEPEHVERVFPLAWAGWQLLLIVASAGVLAVRCARER
ncbi:metal-dependent hydrolase [Halobaculum gomorrense]|uniref:LexA-binding, inner membrane-associated putative hydrolase n=1 Tax=Halobaculum gomorrense TaxID=43928 RepID=A0A1M5TJG9_9EURY|nr:metal-dependent hydrolase [Halobaculum gomorrense]SHH50907.1 LexA-binding, inner membrane-associated putative hydrolase [Halobaculum gomorrense]